MASVLAAACGALLCFYGYFSVVPRDAPNPGPYTRQMAALWHVPFFDAIPQTTAYKVYLLILALSSVGLAIWGLRRPASPMSLRGVQTGSSSWLPFSLATLAIIPSLNVVQVSTFGSGGRETLGAIGLSALLFVVLRPILCRISPKYLTRLLSALLVVYVAVMIIPGFLTLPSLESDLILKVVDWHFDAVIGSAEQLRDGMVAFSDIVPLYGIAGPGLIGALQEVVGPLNFAAHIRLIQVFQVIYLILALITFRLWAGRVSLTVLVGAALIGPYLGTSHGAILYPNLSGWRFIGLPCAVLLFLLARRADAKFPVWALGALTGLLLLHSPEIAILVGSGGVVFLLVRRGALLEFRHPVWLVPFGLGVLLSWAAYLLVHRLAFDAMPRNFERLFDTLLRISGTGFSGSRIFYDPTFVVMALLSAYQCSKMFLRAVRRGLSHRERVTFSVSVMSLLWLAYYVNRALPVNLWTQLYFLPFLLPRGIFSFPVRASQRAGSELRNNFRPVATCVYIFLLGPLVLVAHHAYFAESPSAPLMRSASKDSKLADGSARHFVSGVAVTPSASKILSERTEFLKRHRKDGIHVVTKLPYTTRLVAGEPGVWIVNPFNQWNESDFAPSVNRIVKRRPKLIVFDIGNDGILFEAPKAEKNWSKLCDRFKRLLAGKYHQVGESSGWEVWELSQ